MSQSRCRYCRFRCFLRPRWDTASIPSLSPSSSPSSSPTLTLSFSHRAEAFHALPDRPDHLQCHGMIVHLVSYVEGIVREVRHLDIINSLPSFLLLDMPLDLGDRVCKTVDIRTDSGYVLLCNENDSQLQSDFQYIVQLQESMFEVEDESEERKGAMGEEAPPASTLSSLQEGAAAYIDDLAPEESSLQRASPELVSEEDMVVFEQEMGVSVDGVPEEWDGQEQLTFPRRNLLLEVRQSSLRTNAITRRALRVVVSTALKAVVLYLLGSSLAVALPFLKALHLKA